MQPNKPLAPRIYGIEEPGDVAPDAVPQMCVGCPESQASDEGRFPRVYSLEDPPEYYISQRPQVAITRTLDVAASLGKDVPEREFHQDVPGDAERVKVTQLRTLLRMDPDVIILGEVRRPVPDLAAKAGSTATGIDAEGIEMVIPAAQQAPLTRAASDTGGEGVTGIIRCDPATVISGEPLDERDFDSRAK